MDRVLICGLEGGAGASVVALALRRVLEPLGRRPVYFKPVGEGPGDPDVELLGAAGDSEASNVQAVSRREAAALVAAGRSAELLDRIAAAAERRAAAGDFLLAEGINDERDAFGVKLNEQIAARLGAAVLLVVHGGVRPDPAAVDDLVASVRTAAQLFREAGVAVLGVIVNRTRVDTSGPASRFESFEALARSLGAAFAATDVPLLGVLPERPLLAAPTLAEIAEALDAEVLAGRDALDTVVLRVVVADMEPRHLIPALRHEGTLVVTSGDRDSILLTLACVQSSRRRSGVAGVVLTGGLRPDPAVLELAREMEIKRLPALAVRTEAFETAARIRGLRVRLRERDRERVEQAATTLAILLDRDALLAALAVAPLAPRLAALGPSGFLEQLLARARESRAHVVLPEGDEPRTLQAVARVLAERVARVTLLGDAEAIGKRAAELGLVLEGEVAIVDPRRSPDLDRYADVVVEARKHKRGGVTKEAARDWLLESTIQFGVAMVKAGDADGLVSGALHSTADTVRPALQVIGVRPDVGLASSVFFMALADRVLVYGDCAIVPDPNARELAAIAIASARTARAFGVEPRVALLSYSTAGSGAGQSVDKVGEAMALLRERGLDFPVDGPMQYDAAVDPEVARLKMPGSAVAGRANVFIFPDLDAGNIAYKAVQRTTGALAIGPVLQGLNRPVNDLSRGCSVDDVVYTIAATAIQARAGA